MNRLDEIAARAASAADGPWYADGFADGDTISLDVYVPGAAHAVARDIRSHPDADFIANARTDVPALVAALRAVLDVVDDHDVDVHKFYTADLRDAITSALGGER